MQGFVRSLPEQLVQGSFHSSASPQCFHFDCLGSLDMNIIISNDQACMCYHYPKIHSLIGYRASTIDFAQNEHFPHTSGVPGLHLPVL